MALVTSSPSHISGQHPLALVVRGILNNLWKSLSWAWLDTVCQYRRSRIGPLWETINVLVMLLGLTIVSSAIFGTSMVDIVGYIGLGIIIWTAISWWRTLCCGLRRFLLRSSSPSAGAHFDDTHHPATPNWTAGVGSGFHRGPTTSANISPASLRQLCAPGWSGGIVEGLSRWIGAYFDSA